MPQQKIEWGYANIEEHLYLKHLPTKNYFLVGGLHKVKGCSLVRCNSCPTEYKPLDLEAAALFIGLGRFDFDYLDSEEYKLSLIHI